MHAIMTGIGAVVVLLALAGFFRALWRPSGRNCGEGDYEALSGGGQATPGEDRSLGGFDGGSHH